MADAVGLELLGERPLLLDICARAVAEGAVDLGRVAGVDRRQAGVVDTRPMTGVFEHGERLAAADSTTSAPSSLRQSKSGSGSRPVRKKPSISLIWAKWRTPDPRPATAARSPGSAPTGRHGRCRPRGRRWPTPPAARPTNRPPALLGQEPAGHGRDQRRVEGREQGELDVDTGHRRRSFRRCGARAPASLRRPRRPSLCCRRARPPRRMIQRTTLGRDPW